MPEEFASPVLVFLECWEIEKVMTDKKKAYFHKPMESGVNQSI
jgi:hypothetical protein